MGGVARRYALAAIPAAASACFMLWSLLLRAFELYQVTAETVCVFPVVVMVVFGLRNFRHDLDMLPVVEAAAAGPEAVPGMWKTTAMCICTCLCAAAFTSTNCQVAVRGKQKAPWSLRRRQSIKSWQCPAGRSSCCFRLWRTGLPAQGSSCRQAALSESQHNRCPFTP